MKERKYFGENPILPGIIIEARYVKPLNKSNAEICKGTGISPSQFSRVLNGVSRITPTMAREMGRLFDVSPMVFLELQDRYDLAILAIEENGNTGGAVEEDKPKSRGTAKTV